MTPWKERLRRAWSHPVARWTERAFWVVLALFVLHRLGPQISALTGIGPTLGTAPAFEVTTLDGTDIDSETLRGKVVVVNFWATWCVPCRVEMPAFQKLHERYSDDQVLVLGLATDAQGARVVEPWLRERGISFPVALATPALERKFGGISAIPTTFIIGPDGVIRNRVFGLFAPPAMNAAVKRLVEAGGG